MNKNLIPIFFATDNNYMPYLDVAMTSLVEHTTSENFYQIYVLNTGLDENYKNMMKRLEKENVSITFYDISFYVSEIKEKLKEVLHFGIATYYRLFIQSMFMQYKKVLYLDCDIVVLNDVAKLYNIDLGDNMLAGAIEQFVANTIEYRAYARYALGVDPDRYINAGILLMDLEKFRENKIEEKFSKMIMDYDFELIDPDQAYLNFLCRDKILILQRSWNKTNYPIAYNGEVNIVHFALAEKPWQSDVENGDIFWKYARASAFYDIIKQNRQNFSDEQRMKKREAELVLRKKALDIVASENNIYKKVLLEFLQGATIQKGKEIYGEI